MIDAIDVTNFKKEVGPDGFCVQIIKKDRRWRMFLARKVLGWINNEEVPEYLA